MSKRQRPLPPKFIYMLMDADGMIHGELVSVNKEKIEAVAEPGDTIVHYERDFYERK